MNRNRRTRYGILVVAVGLLAAAGLAWAQSPTYPSESQLTDQQARQLEELRGRYETKMLTLEKQLAAAEVELDRAMTRPDTDTDRVLALRREVRNLEGQLEDIHLQASAEAGKVMGVPPGMSYQGGMNWMAYGRGSSWHGSCAWDNCPWDASWHDGNRASRWWRPGSWMGRSDTRTVRGRCW
jgi:hypothetical protein